MKALALALSFITYRPSRSLVLILFVFLAVVAAIWSTALTRTTEANLQNSLAGMEKIGADVVVIRRGSSQRYTEVGNVELLQIAQRIRETNDVVGVSTELRLFTYKNCPWSDQPKAYIYAIDPKTDFTVSLWLPKDASASLGQNEVYVGNNIILPGSQEIVTLAGLDLRVVERLEKTGTTLDDTLFVTFSTARVLAKNYQTLKESVPGLEANYVPVFMVALSEGANALEAASRILAVVPGVSTFESFEFYRAGREQLTGLIHSLDKIFLFVWFGALIGTATVFLISLNERRREIGVLRVLGASRGFAFRTIITEGFMLAIIGAVPGVIIGWLASAFVLPGLISGLGDYQLTSAQRLGSGASGLAVAALSVVIATLIPIWWVFRRDPAVSMRG
jgi:putative ABC transport system permease protein